MMMPFSHREQATISEVFSQYDGLDQTVAWTEITRRWHATSGRFYAYNTAHNVAAECARRES